MPEQTINTSVVLPVFVLDKWLPDNSSVVDLCKAAEQVTGPGTIDGATLINGLWRVQAFKEVTRLKLLTNGVTMGSKLIRFEGISPLVRGGGKECNGTRLTISNLPFSYGNDAVARNLAAAGLKVRSKIHFEKARGEDRMLTDWRNGRRFCYIDLPVHQVARQCKMGDFTALLYYREMKQTMQCRNCLKTGHRAFECPNDITCLACKKPGHRRGDDICEMVSEVFSVWGFHAGDEGSGTVEVENIQEDDGSGDKNENDMIEDIYSDEKSDIAENNEEDDDDSENEEEEVSEDHVCDQNSDEEEETIGNVCDDENKTEEEVRSSSADDTVDKHTSNDNERIVQDAEGSAESGAELGTNAGEPIRNDEDLEVDGERVEIENREGKINQETAKLNNVVLSTDLAGDNKNNEKGESQNMSSEDRNCVYKDSHKDKNKTKENIHSKRGKPKSEKLKSKIPNVNQTPRQRDEKQTSIKNFVSKEGSVKRAIHESSSPGDDVKIGLGLKNQKIK